MKKVQLFLLSMILTVHAIAQNIIDVYGVDSDQSKKIIKEYGEKIDQLTDKYFTEVTNSSIGLESEAQIKLIKKEKNGLMEKMKTNENLLYADISTTFYPDDKNTYTMLEVITKKQAERLRFLDPEISIKKSQSKHDLIDKMIEYLDMEMNLLMDNQIDFKNISCPVYHCTTGFHHPKLKPYLNVFNTGARKEKKLIIDTLKNDRDPERRAAAAFLMGHFDNPEEIISQLDAQLEDKDSGVRNNVMRVLGSTMSKSHRYKINIKPLVDLLDSPYSTDRNKALYTLILASDSDYSKKFIAQHAGDKLVKMLSLKQPNNSEPSYLLLKKISGKNYSDKDIVSWKEWLSSMLV